MYDVTPQNIGQHIKKVFDDGELSSDSVVKKFFITAADGKDYDTMHYNLQMIIAVGFKVNKPHPRTAFAAYHIAQRHKDVQANRVDELNAS